MTEIAVNQPKTRNAFDYFVLFFCLLVPTIGTLGLLVLLDRLSNERLVLCGTVCVYFSSVILGLFSAKRFRKNHGGADFWALIVGTVLSGISGLVAAGVLILSYVAAGLNIH